MTPYDTDNIFAKILRGEIPAHKVAEDEHSFIFMDIMPRTPGHALVIPKAPGRNLLDIAPGELGKVILTVQRVAKAAMAAFAAHGVQISQYSEPASGQTVFHLHFHVMPRFEGVPLRPPGGDVAPNETLAANAAKLRDTLAAMRG